MGNDKTSKKSEVVMSKTWGAGLLMLIKNITSKTNY